MQNLRQRMKKNDRTVIGSIMIILWLSHLAYFYSFPIPFRPHDGIDKLSKEVAESPEFIKEYAGLGGETQTGIKNRLRWSFFIQGTIGLIKIAIGVLAGFLFIKRKKMGHILSLGLSIIWVSGHIYYHVKYFESVEQYYYIYSLMFQWHPIHVIHNDIISTILFAIFIIYLLQPSVLKEYYRKQT